MQKKNKSNTAIICLSPYNGGMELDAVKTALHLSKIANITLIVKKETFLENKVNEINNDKIETKTIKFKNSFSLSIIKNIRKIIQENNIKNVIFFGASELKSLFFAFWGLDINLCVRHGTTKSTPKKDFFHRLIYSNVDWHIANSKHILNNVRYIIPYGKNTKDIVIYPSFEFNEPKITKKEKLSILHVGRIAEGKGQIDAIKACKILVKNNIDFELNLVGGFDKDYEKKFKNFLDNCDYKDKINLVGFTNDVEKYYNSSDIFLFPSYGEGLSNAFIEALAHNLVCICYNNTSFSEFRKLGFYYKMIGNKNIQKLSATLYQIVKNLDNERYKCKKNSRLVDKIFSVENELTFYKKILI